LKIIYLIRAYDNKFGGAEQYLSRLSKVLAKQNISHKVVNSIFPKFLPSWLSAILFNLQVCLIKRDKFYFSLDRVSCPDVYRAGDGVHKVFLGIENKSRLNPLHPVYLFLERRCFNNSKRIIANSQLIKNQIINTYGIAPSKIDVVYNGVELKDFDYQASFAKLSQEFLIGNKQKILLYVGSGFKRKGVEEFLQIVSRLKGHNIRAFIVGKDKKIKYYQQMAKELSIDDIVIFTGPRNDVDDFYAISDIFLFPTHYEPFSNVVLEAMNFNNAVFTTRQNGACEILDSEFIMSSPRDLSVVEKIDKLFLDKKTLQRVQDNNRSKSQEFSIERNLSETLKVIDEVIN